MKLNEVTSRAICYIRKKHGHTQEQVYELCKIQVCNYECGKRLPRENTLKRFCRCYQLNYDIFIRIIKISAEEEIPVEEMIELKWKSLKLQMVV